MFYDMDQVMEWAWEQEIEAVHRGTDADSLRAREVEDDDWAYDPRNEWPDFPPED